MLKQYLRKKAVLINGWRNSRLRRNAPQYDDAVWWDSQFYSEGLSDRQTISSRKHRVSSAYHYNSIELLILRHVFNTRVQRRPELWGAKATDTDLFGDARVLDIGSGSGHWIEFYRSLGARQLVGIDVSRSSVDYLRERYAADPGVSILHGKARDCLAETEGRFDLINAIGVMFHIIDDDEWRETIDALASRLAPGGMLVIGGYFGWIDGLNVQVDADGHVNKRLRSRWRWRRELRRAGLQRLTLLRNRAYLKINDPLPESNLLIAERR